MNFVTDELPAKGAAVVARDGGILSVCLNEPEGEAPTMIVGLQRHDRAMSAQISIADAALIARAVEVMVGRLLLLGQGTSP